MADCMSLSGPGPYGNTVQDSDNQLGVGQPIPGYTTPTDVNMYARVKELYLGGLCAKPAPAGTWSSDAAAQSPWSHWSIMFKSGNMNTADNLCPRTNSSGGSAVGAAVTVGQMQHGARQLAALRGSAAAASAAEQHALARLRSRFDNKPMNQPLMVHSWSTPGTPLPYNGSGIMGYFAGTYDVDPTWSPAQTAAVQAALHNYTQAYFAFRIAEIAADASGAPAPARPAPPSLLSNSSYVFAVWYQNVTSAATAVAPAAPAAPSYEWVYYMAMVTTPQYPWLMNYLRSNDVVGGYGGYPWPGAGLQFGPVPSTGSKLLARLRVLDPGAPHDQFYLPEISGCWKQDGSACDGDPNTDVTRYICFIMAPSVTGACSATNQGACPPLHYFLNGTSVAPSDKEHFPYSCYYMHCPPWGCDAYSNPVPQELVQLLPCEEWAAHGWPSTPGQGWVGDSRQWTLDVGTLGARLYLSGNSPPVTAAVEARMAALRAAQGLPEGQALPPYPGWSREWISFEVGPEQMDSGTGNGTIGHMVRWEVSQWDVQVLQA